MNSVSKGAEKREFSVRDRAPYMLLYAGSAGIGCVFALLAARYLNVLWITTSAGKLPLYMIAACIILLVGMAIASEQEGSWLSPGIVLGVCMFYAATGLYGTLVFRAQQVPPYSLIVDQRGLVKHDLVRLGHYEESDYAAVGLGARFYKVVPDAWGVIEVQQTRVDYIFSEEYLVAHNLKNDLLAIVTKAAEDVLSEIVKQPRKVRMQMNSRLVGKEGYIFREEVYGKLCGAVAKNLGVQGCPLVSAMVRVSNGWPPPG